MTDRQIPTRPDNQKITAPEEAEGSERRLDLSLTQVAGGALAAMTAAALGSRLGVGGTIAGAAFASIIAAVAGSLYTASLHTTREKVKTVWRGPTGRENVAATAAVATSADITGARTAASNPSPLPRLPRYAWRRILIGAVAVFGLAGFLLTGYEAVAGQALSGGSDTTVEQVSSGRQSESKSDEKDEKSDPEEPAEPSASPDESSEPEPAPGEPAPSSEPTVAGTEEPTTEPSAEEPTADAPEAPSRQGAESEAAN